VTKQQVIFIATKQTFCFYAMFRLNSISQLNPAHKVSTALFANFHTWFSNCPCLACLSWILLLPWNAREIPPQKKAVVA